MMSIFMRSLAFCGLLLMAACSSSTSLQQSWFDPGFEKTAVQKVMVMAIAPEDLSRRSYEAAFVKRLQQKKGRQGIHAYQYLPLLSDYDDKAKVREAVRASGADLLLIASLLAVENKETYVPPRQSYSPSFGYAGGYYGYSSMAIHSMYTPGYTRKDVVIRLEVSVFDVKTEKMIWSGITRSFNPSSTAALIKEHVSLVYKEMQNKGVL